MTSPESNALSKAFAVKDEVIGYLTNLTRLKADGVISEDQHASLRNEYEQRLHAANLEIARIKGDIKKRLETVTRDLETQRWELGKLEVKYKVGELPQDQYQSSDHKLRAEIERLEADSELLNRLIEASSSADTGIPEKRTPPAAPGTPPHTEVVAVKQKKFSHKKLLAIAVTAGVIIVAAVLGVSFVTSGSNGGALPPQAIKIPVNIENAANVGSLRFELFYDPAVLQAVGVENGAATGDAMLEYSLDAPGRVIVGIVHGKGINGLGQAAVVAFQMKAKADAPSPLRLENATANDATTMAKLGISASAGSFTADDQSFIAPKIVFSASPSK